MRRHRSIKIDFENGLLYLPKIKNGIKIEIHRKLIGKIKSVTIVKTTSGLYYAAILVETENVKNKVKEPINKVCGIDLGLKEPFSMNMCQMQGTTFYINFPKPLLTITKS